MPALLTLVAALISGELAWAAAGTNPHAWQRWEHSLASTRSHDNPYADVTLQVTYTGPDGRTLRTFGFWDGGATFKIRIAFPQTGRWQWRTTSEPPDEGLHDQRPSYLYFIGTRSLFERAAPACLGGQKNGRHPKKQGARSGHRRSSTSGAGWPFHPGPRPNLR